MAFLFWMSQGMMRRLICSRSRICSETGDGRVLTRKAATLRTGKAGKTVVTPSFGSHRKMTQAQVLTGDNVSTEGGSVDLHAKRSARASTRVHRLGVCGCSRRATDVSISTLSWCMVSDGAVHASSGLFVHCDAVKDGDTQHFSLQFTNVGTDVAVSLINGARPPYSQVKSWPQDMFLPADFLTNGPSSAEIGLGEPVRTATELAGAELVPLLWCCFQSERGSVLLYVNGEIPFNVGIVTQPESIRAITTELDAKISRRL
jgi:hypothetical protein